MRAVQITGFGGPEVMVLNTDAAVPEIQPDELLIRVAAAGVNPLDWKIRAGYLKDVKGAMPDTFPITLGVECAGTVEKVGSGVTGFAVGDEVHGSTGLLGAFADYTAAKAALFAKRPASMSVAEAAALPVATVTAVASLVAGEVGQGTKILIHAAAGGVGVIAVQFAKARGAEVTALGSPGNLEFLKSLGADHVVDRTTRYEDSLGQFDVVLDLFGPEAQARSWGLVKKGGVLLSAAMPPSEEEAAKHGIRAGMVYGAANGAVLAAENKRFEEGKVKVTIANSYPVERFAEAVAEVERGNARGKVLLTF